MGLPSSDFFLDAILLRGLSWCYPVLPGQYTFSAVITDFHISSINHSLITRHCVSPQPYHPFIKFTISQVNEVDSFLQVLTSKWKFQLVFWVRLFLSLKKISHYSNSFFQFQLWYFKVSEYKFRLGGFIFLLVVRRIMAEIHDDWQADVLFLLWRNIIILSWLHFAFFFLTARHIECSSAIDNTFGSRLRSLHRTPNTMLYWPFDIKFQLNLPRA